MTKIMIEIACNNECKELKVIIDKVIDELMVEHDGFIKEQYYLKNELMNKE